MKEMRRLWQDYHLPYFSPYGWAVVFAAGIVIGVAAAWLVWH